MEIISDTDPITTLARTVEIATPVLAANGFELEASGSDWAHWTAGFQNVLRAYAFRRGGTCGVSLHRQGNVGPEMIRVVADAVAEATGWPSVPHA